MANRPSLNTRPPTSDSHHDEEHPDLPAKSARLAWWPMLIYVFLYAGFVDLNTFKPSLMGTRLIAGVNLAVVYGVGLIIAAVVLSLLYMYVGNPAAAPDAKSVKGKGPRPPIANTQKDDTEGGPA